MVSEQSESIAGSWITDPYELCDVTKGNPVKFNLNIRREDGC